LISEGQSGRAILPALTMNNLFPLLLVTINVPINTMHTAKGKPYCYKKVIKKQMMLVALLFYVLIISGCGRGHYFEEYRSVNVEHWFADDIKEFPFHINDTASNYTVIFIVRNTTDYSYSNLYVFFNMVNPDQSIMRDTVECLLADRYGRWLGKGFGKIRESSFLIKNQINFSDTGNYVLAIEQAMRDQALSGIADIGIRIEKDSSSY
jgi:gliding motility-associated lipoprotein GldH